MILKQMRIKGLQKYKAKLGTFFMILLFSEVVILPTLYAMALLFPKPLKGYVTEFNVNWMIEVAPRENWGNGNRLGISGGYVNVFHAKKGYYFELECISLSYMHDRVKGIKLTKTNDYTLQWFINHTVVQFRSEFWESIPWAPM